MWYLEGADFGNGEKYGRMKRIGDNRVRFRGKKFLP